MMASSALSTEGNTRIMSTEEGIKALARRLLEAFVNRDLDTIEKLLASDFVDRSLLPGQGSRIQAVGGRIP
jgi:hypothetical protein